MRLEIHVHNTEKLLLLFDLSRAFSALMELGERERTEDIPLFADRVIATPSERSGKRIRGIDREALEMIVRFDWPGNVRELQNEIEQAVAIAHDGDTITPAHLSAKLRRTAPSEEASAAK